MLLQGEQKTGRGEAQDAEQGEISQSPVWQIRWRETGLRKSTHFIVATRNIFKYSPFRSLAFEKLILKWFHFSFFSVFYFLKAFSQLLHFAIPLVFLCSMFIENSIHASITLCIHMHLHGDIKTKGSYAEKELLFSDNHSDFNAKYLLICFSCAMKNALTLQLAAGIDTRTLRFNYLFGVFKCYLLVLLVVQVVILKTCFQVSNAFQHFS